jgi:hypothetical protein
MRTAFIILALCLAGALADGFHPRNSRRHGRQGRRLQQNFRIQGRNRAFRRGRTDVELEAAPLGLYGAADTTDAPEVLPPPGDYAASPLTTDYEYDDAALSGYAADEGLGADADPNLAMLEKAVPGIPGEDYPIFAEVPESGFSCDGQVDGGYYADPEAQCQVFHICTADGQGGLAKYSFLCPNGTIFNQNYFICDWWFNFDCAEAEGLYGLNDEIAAERDALAGAGEEEITDSYGAAPAAEVLYDYEEPLPTDYDYGTPDEYAAATEAAPAAYGAPDDAILPTNPPPVYEADREARRFSGRRGRTGRRNSFRGNGRRQGRRQGGRRGNQRNFRG